MHTGGAGRVEKLYCILARSMLAFSVLLSDSLGCFQMAKPT